MPPLDQSPNLSIIAFVTDRQKTERTPNTRAPTREPEMNTTQDLPEVRNWTPDQVRLVRDMWADGETASDIALKLRGKTRSAVIGIIQRSGFKRRAGVVKRTQPRAPKLHVVSRGPGSRGGPKPSRKPEAVRKMIATKWALNEPAPITLAGPVWSLPPNARPVERSSERRAAA